MVKAVVVLSWWFVLLFIVRDIPSRNVVLHICFPTKKRFPLFGASKPRNLLRSKQRLTDLRDKTLAVRQKREAVGHGDATREMTWIYPPPHPGWQSPPAWHHIFSIGNPNLNLRFLWLACIVVGRFLNLGPGRAGWVWDGQSDDCQVLRLLKKFFEFPQRLEVSGDWLKKMPTGPRGFLRYGREVAVMPQNVAERVAKRGESQEFVLGGSSRLHRERCRLDAFSRNSSWSSPVFSTS